MTFCSLFSVARVQAQDSTKPAGDPVRIQPVRPKAAAPDTLQRIIPGRVNDAAQQKKPYVILISADGFRFDLADKDSAVNLQRLRAGGVTAAYLQPCYPSLTFPNHYSIVTGLYPSHHGIVNNTFYDRKKDFTYAINKRKAVSDSSWYGGTPLWVLAEKQKMISASFFWVASEAAIQGVRPTYYFNYSTAFGVDRRIQIVKEWLELPEESRPHFITFYLYDVDHAEHEHGVNSPEASRAVHLVDENIGKLVRTVDSLHLPVNFIFVSDHGMVDVDTVNKLSIPHQVDTTEIYIAGGLTIEHGYAKQGPTDASALVASINNSARQIAGTKKPPFTAYTPDQTPAIWHYRSSDDRFGRIGDFILVPDPPRMFVTRGGTLPAAEHGYDNRLPGMRASFYAWGPAFRKGLKIDGFENINIYPLIASILGLSIKEPIDGKLKVLQNTLRKL